MTPAQRIKIAHDACEALETCKIYWSCEAITASSCGYETAKEYSYFWFESRGLIVKDIEGTGWLKRKNPRKQDKHHRILAILTWAYCPEEMRP